MIDRIFAFFDSMTKAEKVGFLSILSVSVALKLWNIFDPFRLGFHSDEAILGLMAKHFWDGNFAYFYYGQTYGGGLEYMLDCLFYAMVPHGVAPLRMASGVMMLAAELLVYYCARDVFTSTSARLATLLIFMSGGFVIPFELSQSHGVHLNNLLVMAALMAIYLRAEHILPQPAITGFVVGIGYWVSSYIWIILAFAAVIPLVRQVALKRYFGDTTMRGVGTFLLFALLGGLPRVLYLLDSDGWNNVSPIGGYVLGSPEKIANTAALFFYNGLPRFFLGDYAEQFVSFGRLFSTVWLLLILGALLTATVQSHKSRALLWAVSGCSAVTIALVVTNAFSYDSGWRYVWSLLFAMAFGAGYLCESWQMAGKPRRAPITLTYVVVGIAGVVGVFANVVSPRLVTPKHNQYAPVISALVENDCEFGFAFWEYAYPIDFLTEERIVLESTGLTRVESYGEQVGAAHRRCYIFSRPATIAESDLRLRLTGFWQSNNIEITEQAFEDVTLIVEHLPGAT